MTSILLNYYNFHEDWAFATLSKILKKGMSCVVMPLAFRDYEVFDNDSWQALYGENGEKYDRIVAPLFAYGVTDITFVNYFDIKPNTKEVVENADILLFTGGLPEKIVQRLAKLGLTNSIKNFKGILIGVSAGAMMQFDNYHITPDDDYDSYSAKNKGLAILSGFDLEVHFENTAVQQQSLKQALADNKKPVFAIWHESGLVVENEKITIMGRVEYYK